MQDDLEIPSETWYPASGSRFCVSAEGAGTAPSCPHPPCSQGASGCCDGNQLCALGVRESSGPQGEPPRRLHLWAPANCGLLVKSVPAGPTAPHLQDAQGSSCSVGPLPTPNADSILSVIGLTPQVKIRPEGSQEWGQSGHAFPPKGPPSPWSHVPSTRSITGLCTQGALQEASGEQRCQVVSKADITH